MCILTEGVECSVSAIKKAESNKTVYVCMCAGVYVCRCVCVQVCMYVCVYVCRCVGRAFFMAKTFKVS